MYSSSISLRCSLSTLSVLLELFDFLFCDGLTEGGEPIEGDFGELGSDEESFGLSYSLFRSFVAKGLFLHYAVC